MHSAVHLAVEVAQDQLGGTLNPTDRFGTQVGQEFNHQPGGSNVVYLDGHVEFVKYPDRWPVNQLMATLQGL